MKTTMFASLFTVAAAGGDLSLTWKDCGAKHAVTTDVQPSSLTLGQATKITGTGTVDEDVTDGTFDAEVKAGGGLIDQHFTGKICEAKSFNLPLGIGTLDWAGVDCPLAAGTTSIGMTVTLASALPASVATSDITLKALDQNAEDLLCVSLHAAKSDDLEQGNCDGAACPSICECAFSSCSSAVNACLEDDTCKAAQSCVLACDCGNTACAAACAAGAGDLGNAVLNCLASSCGGESFESFMQGGDLALTWKDCGAKHAVTTDVQPSSLTLGQATEITGTGTVDEDVTDGTFDAEVKAGGGLIDQHFTGKICEAKSFNLPLGIGTLDWAGVDCPLAAGTTSIKMTVTLASALPASVATSDITLKALDQNAEDLLCVSLHAAKSDDLEQGNCDGAACPSICDCAFSSCSSAVNACLDDDTCKAAQSCVLACDCGNTACAAACAAGAGDLGNAVLNCLASSCGGASLFI